LIHVKILFCIDSATEVLCNERMTLFALIQKDGLIVAYYLQAITLTINTYFFNGKRTLQ
jgi:hypothetical protein